MEEQKQYGKIEYHIQMLSASIKNEVNMKAIISLLVDIKTHLANGDRDQIADELADKMDRWRDDLIQDMTEL